MFHSSLSPLTSTIRMYQGLSNFSLFEYSNVSNTWFEYNSNNKRLYFILRYSVGIIFDRRDIDRFRSLRDFDQQPISAFNFLFAIVSYYPPLSTIFSKTRNNNLCLVYSESNGTGWQRGQDVSTKLMLLFWKLLNFTFVLYSKR